MMDKNKDIYIYTLIYPNTNTFTNYKELQVF